MTSSSSLPGFFISFEGIDGCGKSTQAELCAAALQARFGSTRPVVFTRNPGGTKLGQEIRKTLLTPRAADEWVSPHCELLLYMADRAQHVAEVVKPTLEAGGIVVCDRFHDSTMAYQGYGRGLNKEEIVTLNTIATQGILPQLTFLFEANPNQLTERIASRNAGKDRLEQEAMSFHHNVYNGFIALRIAEPNRIYSLNALRPIETLHEEVMARLLPHLEERFLSQASA